MGKEIVLTTDNIIDLTIPIVVAIITWILSRAKKPDYGKKDWKCKLERSAFEEYTFFLAFVFLFPIIVYILSLLLWGIIISPIIEFWNVDIGKLITAQKVCDIGTLIFSYIIICMWAQKIKIQFVLNKSRKMEKCIQNILVYTPIIMNSFVSSIITWEDDMSYYPSIFSLLIVIFQIIGLVFLDIREKYINQKVKIITNENKVYIASVEKVHKKGKWLRILKQELPRKEILIIFDDIRSMEYFD